MTRSISLGVGNYILIQSTFLVLQYGFKFGMPWWVVWFPTLTISVILTIMLLVLFIVAVLAMITE